MNRLSPIIKNGGMPLILMHGDGFFCHAPQNTWGMTLKG
jgi:hypothetical protein